jgi:hypothetical protein
MSEEKCLRSGWYLNVEEENLTFSYLCSCLSKKKEEGRDKAGRSNTAILYSALKTENIEKLRKLLRKKAGERRKRRRKHAVMKAIENQ